jgi:tryptophan synthase beta chain
MGTEDMARQALNVSRMRMLGAKVIGVNSGSCTLKDAINEAMRDWVTNVRTTHYLLGSVLGAHPYPTMVRDFHTCIGREARAQILAAEMRLPTHLFACVGGGSNAIGLFHEFLKDESVKMIGVEAGGTGVGLGQHAARLAQPQGYTGAKPGVLQGTYTYILQTDDGQVATTHSVSAGLDYPAIGPEHAWLADCHRAEYMPISDADAISAAELLARTEGIIPALESAHAIAGLIERVTNKKTLCSSASTAERSTASNESVVLSSAQPNEGSQRPLQANLSSDVGRSLSSNRSLSGLTKDDLVIVNLSGRGDKDMATYSRILGE